MKSILTIAFLLLCLRVMAQEIKGTVTDGSNGKPIPNASIYLNGSSKGTVSDINGKFSLHASETNIPLVVSYVGYTTQSIENYAGKNLNIVLKPKSTLLKEVVIGYDAISREEEKHIFLKEFIGATGEDCVITNPDDINFKYQKKTNTLTATADNPLIILNKKLGYKITYFLDGFKRDPNHTTYNGNYFFAEDTAGLTAKEIKSVLKARDDAYFGSRMHFIRALWANDLASNNFELFDQDNIRIEKSILAINNNKRFIQFNGTIQIVKTKNWVAGGSYIKLNDSTRAAFIDSTGFYDQLISWSGEMAGQRVNKLLPFEFKPLNYKPQAATADIKISVPLNKNTQLTNLITRQDSFLKSHTPEKLYLQLDKTNYGINDTLWFKAYSFNASSLQASTESSIAYIELSDESNIVQTRRMVILTNGLGSGSIPLPSRDFPEGGYTIRAYTQWMRNFDESNIFKKQFYVSDVNRDKWLISYNSAIKDEVAQLHLQLTGTDKKYIANQQILLGVRQGESILRRDKPQVTSPNGTIDLAIAVRDKPEPVYASLHKGSYDDKFPVYKFPIIYNRPEKTDVQFMPEGGYLVTGITSKVGFKAIGEDGKGVNLSGSIVDNTNKQVTSFTAQAKGMGAFTFAPKPGVSYKALISLPDGTKKEYPIPEVKPTGTVLSVTNPVQGDSVIINIKASEGLNNHYMLLGQSRGLVCYGASVNLTANNTQTLKAPKNAFASGIVKFTLLNDQLTTLNERLIYIDQKDNLKITVTPNRKTYAPQDSIALNVEVKDNNNNPVQGNFSMSVINDMRLNNDTAKTSIITGMLLTSDLKGNVEDPAYYFTDNHTQELDNLLLTQGWTGFDWKNIMQPEKKPEYSAEKDISISGKITNLGGSGVKNATVSLLSFRPVYNQDTQTDDAGNFVLQDIPQIDSAIYIRARNTKGKASTYAIDLNKPDWPQFSKNQLQVPWYLNANSAQLAKADTLIKNIEKVESLEGLTGNVLKEVQVRDKRIVNGSHNLNGTGVADQVIDEHEIAKEKPITLLELLKKKVKGFRTEGIGRATRYFVGTEEINVNGVNQSHSHSRVPILGLFIFDGLQLRDFVRGGDVYDLFNYYTSNDIKGVEIMSKAYTSQYELRYLTLDELKMITFPVPFIEITTRAGTGPFMKKALADIVYKPIPAVSPKAFYRPAYPVKNAVAAAYDQRITIHWEPNIITDKDGKAIVTFYAAGQPATYTITTEGSNMNGNVGSSTQKLVIK